MTARYDDDRLLSAWLHDVAPTREPEQLLGEVLARTARTARRPAWRIPERWLPMSAITSRFAPETPVPWRLIAATAAALLALAVGLVLVSSGALNRSAPPYGLADNGRIFYSSDGRLFARSADGTVDQLFAGSEAFAPQLSPDGTKVAFLRSVTGGTEVWAANTDGSNEHRLGIPDRDVDWLGWSPQGDVAIVLVRSRPSVLMVAPADGGPPASFDLGVFIDWPVFRPVAGSQVAFLGKVNDEHGIYLVGRDGSDVQRLDLDRGFQQDSNYAVDKDYYFWAMSWSPTGDRLLYTQLEPAPGSPAGAGFRNHLATIDAAGNVVSDEILEFDPTTDDEFSGTWSPSGDAMVFENLEGNRHWLSYATLGPDGPGPARDLGVEAQDWIWSQFSPDGRSVLAGLPGANGGPASVVLISLDDGSITPLAIGDDAVWQRRPIGSR